MIKLVLLVVLVYFVTRALTKLLASQPKRGVDDQAHAQTDRRRSPSEILGVAPTASQNDIRAAYQRLVQENHPDRVATMSQEIRDLAERRTKEINQAYDALKRA